MSKRGFLDSETEARELILSVSPALIGSRVRRERLAKKTSIRDLAASANLSPHSITRLEAGEQFRPITLVKVCEALEIHVDRIASAQDDDIAVAHLTADDQWHLLDGYTQGALDPELTPNQRHLLAQDSSQNPLKILKSRLGNGEMIATVIEVVTPSQPRSHPGEEFVYALKGPVIINVAGKDYELETNESLAFWGTEPHAYSPVGKTVGVLLSVRSR